ncbi:VirD4-like conjugal transfer protein, CD1115 family [Chakrabartyella piscis]|uniref:VirD4-like conjugal transfer protein, CD1115 family n=1 Tax=Chakrabartyella piscis TaxID=2918914 RepID=UPI002F404309
MEVSQIKTSNLLPLIILGVVFILFMIVVFLLEQKNSLNIKSKTVGDGQYGTARFATEKEKQKQFQYVDFTPEKWRKQPPKDLPQGLIIGCRKSKHKMIAIVDDGDVHALMIGAAGVGKTAKFLYPNLEYCCAAGMSFLVTDTKGDVLRSYGPVAKAYGYDISVLDLRNPTQSDGFNMLNLVNQYMDNFLQTGSLVAKAKAEKYAKIIAKTIVQNGLEGGAGQNSYFYDSAEGLVTAVILVIAEFCSPVKFEIEGEQRHIVSVFKMIQDLLAVEKNEQSKFKTLMDKLPDDHKARWLSGAALNTSDQGMASVMSTALSKLNAFLDSEVEQLLCFESKVDTEKFVKEKSTLFLILPEEDQTKFFLVSLIVQQLYREMLTIADEMGGKLPNRTIFFLDEFGVLPKIESAEMMFSASRSRRISFVPIIQSLAQLTKNYGKEGGEIIMDNCQIGLYGGFAPNSETANVLSKNLGERTVLSGSTSKGKEHSKSYQMVGRPLMSPDEIKAMPKDTFIVTRTGINPMKLTLKLFFEWGIVLDQVYVPPKPVVRKVVYANEEEIRQRIIFGGIAEMCKGHGVMKTENPKVDSEITIDKAVKVRR